MSFRVVGGGCCEISGRTDAYDEIVVRLRLAGEGVGPCEARRNLLTAEMRWSSRRVRSGKSLARAMARVV